MRRAPFPELMAAGYAARKQARPEDSRTFFLDAARLASEAGDQSGFAESLCGLAQAERDLGDAANALHHYADAVEIYRRLGPAIGLAYALRHEADVLRELEKTAAAQALYREAEQIYRQQGDAASLDLANTLRGLALASELLGVEESERKAAARALWLEARGLYARSKVQAGVAECDRRLAV